MINVDTDQSRYTAPNGRLFIIGCPKNDIPEEVILAHFINLIGNQARIEVVVANDIKINEDFSKYEAAFIGMGAAHVGRMDANEVVSGDILARINQAHAVLIAGRGIDFENQLLEILRQRYNADRLTIAGTNGAALEQFTTGFKGVANIFIDTECSKNGPNIGTFGRLKDTNVTFGICVEEDAACVIDGGVNAEVIGNGVVYLVDGSRASNTPNMLTHNLRVDILSTGQSFTIPPQ